MSILALARSVLYLQSMRNNLVRFLTTVLFVGSLATFSWAQQPDNTKVNKGEQPTADQAKNRLGSGHDAEDPPGNYGR